MEIGQNLLAKVVFTETGREETIRVVVVTRRETVEIERACVLTCRMTLYADVYDTDQREPQRQTQRERKFLGTIAED